MQAGDPQLTLTVDVSGVVVNLFQPLDMPAEVLPQQVAARPRGSVGDVQFMKEPGASAKPKPEPRPCEPGQPSTLRAPGVPPPRLLELSMERWIMGADLPEFQKA